MNWLRSDRRRSLWVSLLLLPLVMPTPVQPQRAAPPAGKPGTMLSLATRRLIAESNPASPLKPNFSDEAIASALNAMDRRLREHEFQLGVYKANEQLIGFVLDVGAGMATLSSQAFWAIAVSAGAKKQMEHVREVFDQTGVQSAQKLLGHQLALYRDQYNDPTFSKLKGLTADEAFSEIYGKDHPLLSIDLDSLDSRARGVAHGFLLKAIQDTILRDKLESLEIRRLQASEFTAVEKELSGLGRVMSAYITKNQQQLKEIVRVEEEMRAGLQELAGRTEKTEQDVAFLQEFAFGHMTPSQQLAALERGFFPGMREEERDLLRSEIGLAAKRQELSTRVDKYLNGAATLVKIASDLGVDSPFVQEIAKVANIGSHAFEAYQAMLDTNFLGAVSAISGLLGGRRDIAAERHAQLVGMLGEVLAGQKVILQDLEVLRQGIVNIVDNQKLLMEAIVEVSQQIADSHREVMHKLLDLEDHLFTIRSLAVAELREPMGSCRNAVVSRNEFGYSGGVQFGQSLGGDLYVGGSFQDYDALAFHFSNYEGFFEECLKGLMKFDGLSEGRYSPLFLLRTYDADPARFSLRTSRFEPLVQLRTILADNSSPGGEDLVLLMYPSDSLAHLERKLEIGSSGRARLRISSDIAIESLINVDALEEYVLLLSELHPYFELLDRVPSGRPMPLEELATNPRPRIIGKILLLHAFELVNVSIAQQALMAGDILLPEIYESWVKGQSGELEETSPECSTSKLVTARLAADPLLRHNFIRYAFSRELRERGISAFEYAVALASTRAARIRNLVPNYWTILEGQGVCNGLPFCVQVGASVEPLPAGLDLVRGELSLTPDTQNLLHLRSILVGQLAFYELPKIMGERHAAVLIDLAQLKP